MENLIVECEKSNYKTKIHSFEDKKNIKYNGVIIEDNFKNLTSNQYPNTILLSDWLGIFLKKYPVHLLTEVFFLDNAIYISDSSMQMRIKDVFERLIALSLLIIFYL